MISGRNCPGFWCRCTEACPQGCSERGCHDVQVGKGKVVKVTGIENPGRSATVLLRGSNKLVLEVQHH